MIPRPYMPSPRFDPSTSLRASSALAVDFAQDDVDRAQGGDDVGHLVPTAHLAQRRQVDEGRGPHVVAPRVGLAGGDNVETQFSLRILDPSIRLTGRDAHLVLRLARLDRAFGDVAHRLLQDAQALAHLVQPQQVAVVDVAAIAGDDVEIETIVNAVRLGAPYIA